MRKTAEKRQKNRRARMCGSCGIRSPHPWFDVLCLRCFQRLINQAIARLLLCACESEKDKPTKNEAT